MRLRESGEMYLETVLLLSERVEHVRSLDVANHLGFSKPSVSRAVGKLKSENYINIDQQGYITLTDKGESIARKILEKRKVLKDLIMSWGVDEKTAAADACKIEHVLSDEAFEAIKKNKELNI
ncbi:DtxR family iron (metal) dependent repressor [Ruminococcaceae bacterium R-25]|jgi:Mn-dependent DtxR family transcriptional regulator|nr:DtxR family iron (metal) dependent repressor [Ruminococcaceae bacterium R-25]SUQ11562.1 iron (metal) dependent repressor, DtxR family [Oscillospiraceae bacterium]